MHLHTTLLVHTPPDFRDTDTDWLLLSSSPSKQTDKCVETTKSIM